MRKVEGRSKPKRGESGGDVKSSAPKGVKFLLGAEDVRLGDETKNYFGNLMKGGKKGSLEAFIQGELDEVIAGRKKSEMKEEKGRKQY